MTSDSVSPLAALEARLAQDLEYLGWPGRNWMPPRQVNGEAMLDVAIIGGGQAGLAASVALMQQGIRPVVFDRSPAGSEGPWATTARMETLRSPKELTGPAMGLPALTFRAWLRPSSGWRPGRRWTRSRACSGWTTSSGTAA